MGKHGFAAVPVTTRRFQAGQRTNGMPKEVSMRIDELQVNARKASVLLKAMSNERRLMILCHLACGEKSVSELEELVDLSQSALSQHLARLRRDRLVQTRRNAQSIYYSLNGGDAAAVMMTLRTLYSGVSVRGAGHDESLGTGTVAGMA